MKRIIIVIYLKLVVQTLISEFYLFPINVITLPGKDTHKFILVILVIYIDKSLDVKIQQTKEHLLHLHRHHSLAHFTLNMFRTLTIANIYGKFIQHESV